MNRIFVVAMLLLAILSSTAFSADDEKRKEGEQKKDAQKPEDKPVKTESVGDKAIREAIRLLSRKRVTDKADQDKINDAIAALEKVLRDGEPKPADEKPIAVTAEQLAADYEENRIAANTKYKGKVLEVTGVVKEISEWGKKPCVFWDVKSKYCLMLFARSDAAQLESLKKGDKVTIRGKGDGTDNGNPIVQDCKILKK